MQQEARCRNIGNYALRKLHFAKQVATNGTPYRVITVVVIKSVSAFKVL